MRNTAWRGTGAERRGCFKRRNGVPKPNDHLDISEYRTYKTLINPDDLVMLFAVGSRL
jgi:hypothetical protein